tara:strand:- start:315 stop:665 length:351 start_codon:yes stop_codon:yes gene_type:complete
MRYKVNKDKINKLIKEGYKPLVFMTSDKKYTRMVLKTILQKENDNVVYPIYYNHIKNLLNENQIKFIECYNKVKLLRFNDIVDLNIKSKNLTLSDHEMYLLTMYKAIKNLTYLEQN